MLNKKYIEKFKYYKAINEIYHLEFNYSFLKRLAKLTSVQIISAALLLINNFLLIRLAGEFVYGSYVYIFTWVSLFSIIVLFGMDDYFIANLPKYFFNNTKARTVFRILSWSIGVLLFTFIISVIIAYFFYKAAILNETFYYNKGFFFFFLFELSLLNLLIAFLRAIDKIIIGQVVDKIIRPVLMIVALLILFFIKKNVNLQGLLLLQIFTLAILIAILFLQVFKVAHLAKTQIVVFDRTLKSNSIFFLISLLYLLNVKLDILFLTKSVIPEKVGYYNLSVRFADITGYPLAAVSLIFPTLLAKEKWSNKEMLHKLIKQISYISFFVTGILFIIIALGSKTILSFFGHNFIEGFVPLIILGCTHLISSFSFPLNAYFMISGKQRISLICLSISVSSTFLSCYFLIPIFLLEGAAFSVLIGSIFYFVALQFAFHRIKNINIYT